MPLRPAALAARRRSPGRLTLPLASPGPPARSPPPPPCPPLLPPRLAAEIDRTLKKVQEGVELFESIFEKMNASTNTTQKDKCETDLKTQIKKLQRLRDQIKTWISSSEIKDKNPLLETRKLIETVRPPVASSSLVWRAAGRAGGVEDELSRACSPRCGGLACGPCDGSRRPIQLACWPSACCTPPSDVGQVLTTLPALPSQQMERFKALEKEMKTKAFSKEGLIQAAKLDPAEKAKMDTINWLSSMIDELARQVEASEAEIEVLAASSGKKRGKGSGGERVGELEHLNERRKWHVGRMELIQRMVDNGGISVDTVDGTKEDISYFVESNQVRRRAPSASALARSTDAPAPACPALRPTGGGL